MSDPEKNNSQDESKQLTIARWSDRFFAWLIDLVIVWTVSFAVFLAVFGEYNLGKLSVVEFEYAETRVFVPASIVFFVYWIILEYKTGQSIGKKALRLKITDLKGQKPDLKSIIISSFGKSFIIPIDVILGRIFTDQKRQRIFNRLGNTIVIKIEPAEPEQENISYKMD